MDGSVQALIAPLSGLIGVAVGALLTNRTQHQLARDTAREADLAQRREACVEYLTAYRQLRRFVMTEGANVLFVSHGDLSPATPIFEGAGGHWERVEAATARLEILIDDPVLRDAAVMVKTALWELMRQRMHHQPGGFPAAKLRPSQDAERSFAQEARSALSSRRSARRPRTGAAEGDALPN